MHAFFGLPYPAKKLKTAAGGISGAENKNALSLDRGQSHPAIITHKTAAEVDEEMEIEFFYDFRSSSFLRRTDVTLPPLSSWPPLRKTRSARARRDPDAAAAAAAAAGGVGSTTNRL